MECHLYYAKRQRLKKIKPEFVLNFHLLISGTANCNTEQNKDIILVVLRIVKDTKKI